MARELYIVVMISCKQDDIVQLVTDVFIIILVFYFRYIGIGKDAN